MDLRPIMLHSVASDGITSRKEEMTAGVGGIDMKIWRNRTDASSVAE